MNQYLLGSIGKRRNGEWNISQATYDNKNLDVSSLNLDFKGICLADNNSKLYIGSTSAPSYQIRQYNMSTPKDISTASFINLDTPNVITIEGLFMKTDGLKIYMGRTNFNTLYRFDMPAFRGDFHRIDLSPNPALVNGTTYAITLTYDEYEAGVNEPEWVTNEDGDDNYSAGILANWNGSNWVDS